jgi:hypothetical protein
MRKIASLVGVFLIAAGANADDVKLRYTRPSAIIGHFLEAERPRTDKFIGDINALGSDPKAVVGSFEGTGDGLIPKGIRLLAFDSSGILEVTGPSDAIAKVKQMVQLLDVAPRQMHATVSIRCPVLNVNLKSESLIANNKKFSTYDELLQLSLDLVSRINSDGTVTMFIGVAHSSKEEKVVVRLQPGQQLRFRLGSKPAMEIVKQGESGRLVVDVPSEKGKANIDDPDVILELRVKLVDARS